MKRRTLRARAENLQQRSKLQRSVDQAMLLESMLQLYQGQKRRVEASLLPTLGAVGRNLPYDGLKDAEILQTLSRSVDENYTKLEQVFQAAGLEKVRTEMNDAKVLETEGGGVLQIRAVALQPFGLKAGLKLGKASRVIALKREIVLRGCDDATLQSCTIRVVLKKFVESGREIHVWDAFGDWSQAVSTREYGWGIMAPLDVTMNGVDITSVKNCVFMTSSKLSEGKLNGDLAAEHSVANLYKQIMQDRRRVIETALLDQALRKRIY
ncbi:hypothetical protein PHYSODRAFT_318783 [Phytophthora sojae]|uniref:Uncharacterized protein n=1 Tax=Phytophthora sojae (strain P6497) TaxID=1094619 RepID=G5A6K2_PHYSP|nr:hypothetical protein PHYSODRAFT_318783 [Phytophthora sojae]EGZ08957.1 hypothetical protein PHYSODRAFT_318783 [Phytophthora sojae]|eukprot:XP_009535590.1 hypothetical protein PHYSODRAFT_318783 [Phytophthora sojae]